MIIELLDGTRHDIKDYGMALEDYNIPSLEIEHITEFVEGSDGVSFVDTVFKGRTIPTVLAYHASDSTDFVLLRDLFNSLFSRKESFYIIFKDQPKKRWLVRLANQFQPEKDLETIGSIQVNFVCVIVFSESIGTTTDPFTFESELWQLGQGLIAEDLIYSHTTNIFRIYNAGDVEINPRKLPLTITFAGPSTNLSIKNKTTGDEWAYTGVTTDTDIIILDGIRSLKNDESIFGNTNRKLITLAKGWNDFEITGTADPFQVSFDFRFYYV